MRVCVIGGGAAGLMAALSAAQAGASVLLLEQHDRVGKKLLVTGNGRCNLLNGQVAAHRYSGSGAPYALALLERWTPYALIAQWEKLGLLCRQEEEGRYYPASGHAGAVLDTLRAALRAARVEISTGTAVRSLLPGPKGFRLERAGLPPVEAERVIVATGGAAGIQTGDATGYKLLEELGHDLAPLRPALAPLRTTREAVKGLKGVRACATLTLLDQGRSLRTEAGELLFGEAILSGVAAMGCARLAGSLRQGTCALKVDLLPERSVEAWAAWLRERAAASTDAEAIALLYGLVHPRIALRLLALLDLGPQSSAQAVDPFALATLLRTWTLPVLGTEGFNRAQVTAGGIRMDDFDPTLHSRRTPGLYAAGEVLDVDGDCGGYNLMWAWASGITAGRAAARKD